MSHLASPARLLIATEGQGGVKDVIRVNPHRASTEFSGNRMRFTNIPRLHPCGQAVVRVIGSADQIIQILEGHGGHHRSEDLFAHHFHIHAGVDQHGGLEEVAAVARALAPTERTGSLLQPGGQIPADALQLFLRDERSHIRLGIEARAEPNLAPCLGDPRGNVIKELGMYIQTRTGAAALPMIEKDRRGHPGNRGRHIGVGQDNIG